jgi:drug/metabolite transporter (DMT)-like permease
MTWEITIVLMAVFGAFSAILARHISLVNPKVFVLVGVFVYLAVATSGFIQSIIFGGGLATFPLSTAWPYLIIEGAFIPSAWLIQYRLIRYIGAGNAVTVSTFNTLMAALVGIIYLHEGLSLNFVIGAICIITGTLITLRIQPDTEHHTRVSRIVLLSLILTGATLFAVGMFFEKMAINAIGVWNYSTYGWGMQLVGAMTLFIIFGQKELKHIKLKIIKNSFLLGVIGSISGGLYIYAVSIGTLSHTVVASSGKVAITALLAAIILKERNAMALRITAFTLSISGLWLIIS